MQLTGPLRQTGANGLVERALGCVGRGLRMELNRVLGVEPRPGAKADRRPLDPPPRVLHATVQLRSAVDAEVVRLTGRLNGDEIVFEARVPDTSDFTG